MGLTNFPNQMVSDVKKKTKKWQEDCVDAAISLTVQSRDSETDSYQMGINYDLYNNKLHMEDVLKSINKDGILGKSFPDMIENHPIMSPKIALLVGESVKRRFDWNVAVSTPNVITEKDERIRGKIFERIAELSDPQKSPGMSDSDIEAEIKKLSRWKKYSAGDIRELTVTNLLNYYYEEQNLPTKFSKGFTSAIITNKEFYDVDIYGDKLHVESIDPRTLKYVLSPGDMDIENSDVICHSVYLTPGAIIDRYYDSLTETQMKNIESGVFGTGRKDTGGFRYTPTKMDDPIQLMNFDSLDNYNGITNSEGEIRVDKTMWRSRRKLGKKTFTDENGEKDVTVVPEQYKPNKDLGEEIEWFWINEWWEGVKILDMYIRVRPRPLQFRGVDNLSVGAPGIIGTIYPGDSMVSKAKPYQYMYNIVAYKVQKILAKYKGPMIELDLAKVPEGWNMTKWLKIGDETGFLPTDSFKEGNRGASTGKLAGNVGQNSGKEYSQHAGSYFNDMYGMMAQLNDEMGSILGVSKQREGAIGNRETVGGVEHAVTQSSHVTEELFHYHDYTKLKVLKAIVENAKLLYKEQNSKVIQYLVDGSSIASFDVNGPLINESDYAVMISNSQNITELMNSFKALAPEGMKAGKFNFSNIMDIYLSKSLAETRRTIEEFEEQSDERDRKDGEAQQQAQQAAMEQAAADAARAEELERYKIDQDNETKIEVQRMKDETEKIKAEKDDTDPLEGFVR